MAFEFEKEVLPTTRGIQATKYDELLAHFIKEGDTLFFTEEQMSRSAASQCAKRMIQLDPQKRSFHSGFHTVKRKTFVRVRPTGELPSKEEKDEEEAQSGEHTEVQLPLGQLDSEESCAGQ